MNIVTIAFILIINVHFNNCKCVNSRFNLSKKKLNATQNVIGTGLLHTLDDSVSLIYPKQLGYANHLKQKIYKIKNTSNRIYKIKDSIYDRKTQSIYSSIVDFTNNRGSHIIRLAYNQSDSYNDQTSSTYYYEEQMAPNWSKSIFYENKTSVIISMDINIEQRKLYWLEVEINKVYTLDKWFFVVKDLNNFSNSAKYIQLNHTFTDQLFTHLISVAYDDSNSIQNDSENDIIFFVGVNKILSICSTRNKTCQDYFNSAFYSPIIKKSNNHTKENNELKSSSEFDLAEIQPTIKIDPYVQLYGLNISSNPTEFNNITGIDYDKKNHVLYFNDYIGCRTLKLTFRKNKKSNGYNFNFSKIETILEKNYGLIRITPKISVVHGDYIFWIDTFGIQSSVIYNSCEIEVYSVRYSNSLRKL